MNSILVAEDNEELRNIIKYNLEADGHVVIEACDGCEVSGLMARHAVDVLLVDMVMPEQGGIETIIQVRKTHPHLSIVAISGGGPAGSPEFYLDRAIACGANAALKKPFSSRTLRQTVAQVLGLKVST